MEQSYLNINRDLHPSYRFEVLRDCVKPNDPYYDNGSVWRAVRLMKLDYLLIRDAGRTFVTPYIELEHWIAKLALMLLSRFTTLSDAVDEPEQPQETREDNTPSLLDYGVTVRACEPVNKLFA